MFASYAFTRLDVEIHGEVNAYLLDYVGARALVLHASHLDDLIPHLAGNPSLEHVIVCGDELGPRQ